MLHTYLKQRRPPSRKDVSAAPALKEPPIAIDGTLAALLPPDWRETVPVYRPAMTKAELRSLLDMIVLLERRIAAFSGKIQPIDVRNMIFEAVSKVSEEMHTRCQHAAWALRYAQTRSRDNKGLNSYYGLTIDHLRQYTNINEYTSTAYRGILRFSQPLALFKNVHTEEAFRYILSCAASFHGGLAWAADCLDDYTPNEIQAALLLCPSPCRPDWAECPMTELMAAYAAGVYREAEIVACRVPSVSQASTRYGRRLNGLQLHDFASQARTLYINNNDPSDLADIVDQFGYTNFMSPDIRGMFLPYILGQMAMALRVTLVSQKYDAARHREKPPEAPRHIALGSLPAGLFKPRMPGVRHNLHNSRRAAEKGFPETIGALGLTRLANIFIPYFLARETQTGFIQALIPSTRQAASLLRGLYGMPEPTPLLRLPPEMEKLADVMSASYGDTLQTYFPGTLYAGLTDIRPLLHGGEPRSIDACPPPDIFHNLLLGS